MRIGACCTNDELREFALRGYEGKGAIRDFLISWKKTILAARIDPKKNPENMLLVGDRKRVKSLGMLLRNQELPFDVFIKNYPGSPDYDKDRHWIYKGRFETTRHSNSRKEIKKYAAEVKRPAKSIAFLIFFTPVKGTFASIVTGDDLQADQVRREREAEAISQEDRLARLANKETRVPKTVWVSRREFVRDADVIIETRYRANGICAICLESAPFARLRDGQPYLEVHHKLPLAEGGEDTLENAMALCPNCHRREHHGEHRLTSAASRLPWRGHRHSLKSRRFSGKKCRSKCLDGVDGPCSPASMCHNVVVGERRNGEEPSAMETITIGLDLTKHWFQVHGVDAAGRIVVKRRSRRAEVVAFFRAQEPCLVGMTPRQNSSGGKERLGRTSKRGDKYIRSLLVAGAVLFCAIRASGRTKDGEWVRAMLARKPAKLVAVALANRTARIVWAVIARGDGYRAREIGQGGHFQTAGPHWLFAEKQTPVVWSQPPVQATAGLTSGLAIASVATVTSRSGGAGGCGPPSFLGQAPARTMP